MTSGRRTDKGELVQLLPSAGVLLVWVALMPAAGGFAPRDWLPAGLVLAGLLVMAVVGGGRLVPPARPAALALGLVLAYTAWSALSIAWSDAPGDSWDATNLLLVTALSTWVLSLAPWRPRTVELGMLAFTLAAAVVAAITLIGAIGADDLAARFTDARFNQPLDYPNTAGAFCVIAAIPGLLLAARPGGGPLTKAPALGAGTFLLAFALLPQSRGAVLGGVAAVLVLLLVVPFRWRLAGALLVAGAGVAAAAKPVLDVYDTASAGDGVGPALTSAGWALVAATAVGVAGGVLLSVLERRYKPTGDARVLVRRAGWGIVALAVLAVLGAGVLNAGRISGSVSDQLNSIRNPGTDFTGTAANPSGSNRLLAADPLERYDYWRVALDGLRDHPVTGLGFGAFDHAYTTERRYPKPSKYPHNLLFRVAGETGIVGVALFGGLVVVLVGGQLRRIRDTGRGERAIAAASLATIAYVAVHSSFDWLEAYPVITGPVLALGLMALVARDRSARLADLPASLAPPERRRLLPPVARIPLGVGAALLAVLSLGVPWLALRYEERAVAGWRGDPTAAYADLRRATDLNPLSATAPVDLGLIAVQRGDDDVARRAFATALQREDQWLPHLQLALLAHQDGRRDEAARQFARARAIAPREPALDTAEPLLRARERLSAADATRQVFEPETASPARSS